MRRLKSPSINIRGVVFCVAVVCVLGSAAQAQPWDGSGTPNDPYRIATAEDLNDIGNHPEDFNKHFIMVNDINLADYTGTSFNMIGIYVGWRSPDNKPFRGVFDGNGHRIYNFTHSSTNMIPIGLFRLVNDPNAKIMNLRLVNPNVDAGSGEEAGWLVGSLVGYLEDGTVANCRVEGCQVWGAEPIGGMVAWSEGLITDCYAEGTVIGTYVSDDVGVLLGLNWHGDVINCSSAGFAQGRWDVGGLVGNLSYGTMKNCYSQADANGEGAVGSLIGHHYYSVTTNSWSSGNASGQYGIGGLLGENVYSTASDCYATGIVDGIEKVGGLAGYNKGDLLNSYSVGRVTGTYYVGGLVGKNYVGGTISNCYSTGSVSGANDVGGLVGKNSYGTISDCYAAGSVTGNGRVGGLVGSNEAMIGNSYAVGLVSGTTNVGGLAGYGSGTVLASFWDIQTSGEPNSAGGTGLTTAEMQDANSYIEAGWDFNTPVWKFCSLPDYPKLGWEECPEAATLLDVVSTMLDPNSLKNSNMKNALINKIEAALAMIDEGQYQEAMSKMESATSEKANRSYEGALNKLENDILAKTNGCAETGEPDRNDWIITCEGQEQVYPLVIETIEYVRSLME